MPLNLKKINKYSVAIQDEAIRKIIHGENLEVLEALDKDYSQKIKCIYIDPPYNNGETYTHYDDAIHEKWLHDLSERIGILHRLLSEDGSIWISIDDGEMHYLKVAVDQIFGRSNFITTIVWQQRTTRENRKVFSNNHEYILVYAKNKKAFSKNINKLPASDEMLSRYKNPDNDPRGAWQSVSINVQAGHSVKSQFYKIKGPSGKIHNPPNGRCWAYNEEKIKKLIKDGRVWFGRNGDGVPRLKKYLSESTLGMTPETLWLGEDVGTNKEAKKHLLKIFPDKDVFDTPKPERLIKRIFEIATNPGDLILDAYLGAGASIAVAHKLKRQYIGIDKGEHIINYTLERQKLVLRGEDEGICARKAKEGEGFEFLKLIALSKHNKQSQADA